jgi:hypothetical protein
MSRRKIQDEYTDLKVSRQRKHQLRHPEAEKERMKRWQASDKAKEYQRKFREDRRNEKKTLDINRDL